MAVLPGVYAPLPMVDPFDTRLAALRIWDPDAVVTGLAAAKLTFWPGARVQAIEVAVRRDRAPQPGYRFLRRQIPPELIIEHRGLRLTSPALTALDLCDTVGGEAIDHALRSRMTTLDHLNQAMAQTANRVGNPQRRQLLLDSRDEPWSAAERLAHRLLRAAGITGWRANRGVQLEGMSFYLDIRFRRFKVAIEIDGRETHSEDEAFETDRWRQNLLVLDGWLVLRFTWRMLVERPDEVIRLIRAALMSRGWDVG